MEELKFVMSTMYFLTAMFQNKFGEAPKFYDQKGWHWMLETDKPILFQTEEEAKMVAKEQELEIASLVTVKEIKLYSGLYRHVVSQEKEGFVPKDMEYSFLHGKNFIFLSHTKQLENAKLVEGLCRADRIRDLWIYGTEKENSNESMGEEVKEGTPEQLIFQAYKSLEESKALMLIFDTPQSEIVKLEGVMVFVKKLVTSEFDYENDSFIDNPKDLIVLSYDLLNKAKEEMIKREYQDIQIKKLQSVILFVEKIK